MIKWNCLLNYAMFFMIVIGVSCQDDKQGTYLTDSGSSDGEKSKTQFFTDPIVYENIYQKFIEENKIKETRIPYLIYYAVDSVYEPYMKYSVDYEVEQLRSICVEGANHVNWLILRNTDVLEKKSYEVCQAGRYKVKNIEYHLDKINLWMNDFYSAEGLQVCVDKKFGPLFSCTSDGRWPHKKFQINDKIALALEAVGITTTAKENVRIDGIYEEEYPLANPVFLEELITNDTSILHPFHSANYVGFMHIKSHGHVDYSITGLSKSQMSRKIKRQKKNLGQTLQNNNQADDVQLKKRALKTNVPGFYGSLMKEVAELQQSFSLVDTKTLGIKGEVGVVASGYGDSDQLNQQCGLGTDFSDFFDRSQSKEVNFVKEGLGFADTLVDEALGADADLFLEAQSVYLGNQNGITPDALEDMFIKKIDKEKDLSNKRQSYLFLFLEACDTNLGSPRWDSWGGDLLEGEEYAVKSVYSADGSLWYRNIDWHQMFRVIESVDDSNAHAMIMQYLFLQQSRKFVNNKTELAVQYREKYEDVIDELEKISVSN